MVLSVLNKTIVIDLLDFSPSSNGYAFQIEITNFVESQKLQNKRSTNYFL